MQQILPKRDRVRCVLRSQILRPLATSRVVITLCLVALMCTGEVVVAAYAARVGSRTSAASLPSSQTTSPVIVMGFLGGFVPHDESHHPELQMIRFLRQEYPEQVYFSLFENSKVDKAYHAILNRLGADENGMLSDDEKRRTRILLFGHSWGASAVVALARKPEPKRIPVLLTAQVDSAAKPFQNDRMILSNVLEERNSYQTSGLMHGRSRIIPADRPYDNAGQFSLGVLRSNLQSAVIFPGTPACSPKATLRSNAILRFGRL
jgi:pimeloyl-ACP methyl ester carboxylesterase